jgi:uncharacterized protein (DUF849 family)
MAEPGFPHPITPYEKLIINTALTGMMPTKRDTPHVPVTVEEIVQDAIACCRAGASIVHLHARDEQQRPSRNQEAYARIVGGIRESCPELIICVSTSGRLRDQATFEERSQVLELDGDLKPDMASLMLGSLNFPGRTSVSTPQMIQGLARKMKERGIVPELEAFDMGMINTARVLIKRELIGEPFYFNLLLGSIFATPGTLFDLACMVKGLPLGAHWSAAGIGRFQLKMNMGAILMGGHARVGLEDNIYYDHARKEYATNERLVQRVVRWAHEIGRGVATPQEARAMIGLPAA